MKTSKQARRGAKALFRACLLEGVLNEDRVRQTVQQVVRGKPRGYVAMLSHFQRLVRLEVQRRTARVESPVGLPPALETGLRQNLARLYGDGLDVTFALEPKLIGGLRVRVGSDVYDGSVQARLAALAQAF